MDSEPVTQNTDPPANDSADVRFVIGPPVEPEGYERCGIIPGQKTQLSACPRCNELSGSDLGSTDTRQLCDCEWMKERYPLPRHLIEDRGTTHRLCWCCAAAVVTGSPTSGPYVCGPCLDDLAALDAAVGRHVVPVSPHTEHDHILPRPLPLVPVAVEVMDALESLGDRRIPIPVMFAHRRSRTAELSARIKASGVTGDYVWHHMSWCGHNDVHSESLPSLLTFAADPLAWQAASPRFRQVLETI